MATAHCLLFVAVKRNITWQRQKALNFVFLFLPIDFSFLMDKVNQSKGDPHKCVQCEKVNSEFFRVWS